VGQPRMNTLNYRQTDDNGLSFELLVDGQPLGASVGARGNALPYWIIKDDLPHLPPHGEEPDPDMRIVSVCSCGEYGCGHTQCRVISDGDFITLCDFDVDVSRGGRQKVFRFERSNYDAVVSALVHLSREYAADSVNRRRRRPPDATGGSDGL
jgi:hypothetical protein